MQKNELVNISITFTEETLPTQVLTALAQYTHVYSYIVYRTSPPPAPGEPPAPMTYLVDVLYSKTPRYNTIPIDAVIFQIHRDILHRNKSLRLSNNIITYAQPPLEVLTATYKPLVYRLAFRQHKYWQDVEVEDLIQMCNLRICILYQQGYYIHAGIINRSFINHVLQFLKPERYCPAMVPLDTLVPGTDVPITDTIVDPTTDDEFQAVEDDADTLSLHEEITQEAIRTVKYFLTPRMFDQLLREYSTNMTSNNSRVMMTRLRRQLAALGITMQTIKNSVLNRR